MSKISADGLRMFALNSGAFYSTHCRMAREGASLEAWARHVRGAIIPAYVREFHGAEGTEATAATVGHIAADLSAYYLAHVATLAEG